MSTRRKLLLDGMYVIATPAAVLALPTMGCMCSVGVLCDARLFRQACVTRLLIPGII